MLIKLYLLIVLFWVGFFVIYYVAKRESIYDDGYVSIKEVLKLHINITIVQIIFSLIITLWIKYYQIETIVLIFCVMSVQIYILVNKTKYKGYSNNLFDLVEALSFSTVIVSKIRDMILWAALIVGYIFLADFLSDNFNNKQESSSFYVNMFTVIEFSFMFITDKIFNLTSISIYSLVIFILLPHTILKAINEFISYIIEKNRVISCSRM